MTAVPVDYEQIVQEVYEYILHEGDTAVDVGAHLGRHTLPLAQRVGADGKIFAVEPLPLCREALALAKLNNPTLRDVIDVLPFALSDEPGTGPFVVAQAVPAFSGLREVPYPAPTSTTHIPVRIETLDRLFLNLSELHYLKIDAEGAELHILRGGRKCLEKFRPVVGFEFGTFANRRFEVGPRDMADFWQKLGYTVHAITGQVLDADEFVRCAFQRAIWDYVAVPREKVEMNQRVVEVLSRQRVNWLAVHAELNHARDHQSPGTAVPPLRRCRGPLRPLARGVARLVLMAARMITIPQGLFNRSLLNAVVQLSQDLEAAEAEVRRRDQRLLDLEARVRQLELSLDTVDAEHSGRQQQKHYV